MAAIDRRGQGSLSVGNAGVHSGLLRAALVPLTAAYSAIIRLRNRRYDSQPARAIRVAVPVISIGNITVGGTGKTPLVIEIASRLLARGRRPAVLTRGYGGTADRPADEVLEIRDATPEVAVVVDADRVRGAQRAIGDGADCLVMDDGFQHRRLARDLDLLLVDALDPWGGGRMLPGGRLREPVESIGRADAVMITRAGLAAREMVGAIRDRLAGLTQRGAPILESTPRPVGLIGLDGARTALSTLGGRRVLPVAGIGAPGSFVATLRPHCGEILPIEAFRDHHSYSPADVVRILKSAKLHGAETICTTRKDWVKLARLWPRSAEALPLSRMDIAIEMTSADSVILDDLLRRALGGKTP